MACTLRTDGGVVTARDGGIKFRAGDDHTISVRRENIQIIDELQDAGLQYNRKRKLRCWSFAHYP